MITRIYIDNFRCFVNFEYKPSRKQLILGANGAGKSSLLDALLFLRRIVKLGHSFEQRKILGEKTLWLAQSNQTFELEALVDGAVHVYRLVIDSYEDPPQARVLSESLHFEGKPIFYFEDGKVYLFDEQFQQKVAYPFDWHRSALATLTDSKENRKLTQFKAWFDSLLCFRINPFEMTARAEDEDTYPYYNLGNFAAWYRHVWQSLPIENEKLWNSLRGVLDGFEILKLERAGKGIRSLAAQFKRDNGAIDLELDRLSHGQKCLIGLYAILHFVLGKGGTIIVDEPDNFIALREIQPWLNAVSDAVDESKGQVLLISHHPELMNQWAPDYGVRFVREGAGLVRVKEFRGGDYGPLLPSEIVARGWENE